jgi:hypothetical protein
MTAMQNAPRPSAHWEYLTREAISPLPDAKLRALGEQGWLLTVTVRHGRGGALHYLFKRQVGH